MPFLLDTCAAIWISANARLSDQAVGALDRASDEGTKIFVSPISAWEVGLLVSRGRLALPVDAQSWFIRLLEAPTLELAELSPAALIAASFLPGSPPRDPADQIVIATARALNYTVVTRDKLILKYAEAGHVRALAC